MTVIGIVALVLAGVIVGALVGGFLLIVWINPFKNL